MLPEHYDRSPLMAQEREALAIACRLGVKAKGLTGLKAAKAVLHRFEVPLFAVIALRSQDVRRYCMLRNILYGEMLHRGTTFWQWPSDVWIDLLCSGAEDRWKQYRPLGIHAVLMDLAYLLGGVSDLRAVDQKRNRTAMAEAIFGTDVIAQAFHQITQVLVGKSGRGYSDDYRSIQPLKHDLCTLFLLNRSPSLGDLSPAVFEAAGTPPHALNAAHLGRIKTALWVLGILKPQEAPPTAAALKLEAMDTSGVSPAWLTWCLAWFKQATELPFQRRRRYLEGLFMVGRWLTVNHSAVTTPEQWDEPLALEYVDYLCSATAGEYASAHGRRCLVSKGLVGKPLKPTSIDHRLSVLRHFFRVLQDRPHGVGSAAPGTIARHFNPSLAFATPRPIKRLIHPDPRDIDEVLWCKLTYAAATLSAADYTATWKYPLNCYRAAALLWVTSARRPNEIARLQCGCIRRDWEPAMLDERDLPVADQKEAQLCYLHVPANKTKGSYWVPIPRYAADAVEAWERERPINQPKLVDPKDHTLVDFLFCFRGKQIGNNFINRCLIPVLCQCAGVPEQDARGAITGHRARSTIATLLRKNGVSLDDIAEFLGHTRSEMVKAYARTDPFRFGREMNRANDLLRIVEGLIDTRAARECKPNVFFLLGRGADGKPHFCGNPAWANCRYRLACEKCEMYVGGGQAERLAERLALRDDLFTFQTQVEMTPQEQAAIKGDIEQLTELIEQEAGGVPPTVPNDTFRFNPPVSDRKLLSPCEDASTDLVALAHQLTDLKRALAEAGKRKDGRNAGIRALKRQIADLMARIAALDQITRLDQADGFIPISTIALRKSHP